MGKIRLRSGVFLFLIFSLSFSVEVWGSVGQRRACPSEITLNSLTLAGTEFDSDGEAPIAASPLARQHFCINADDDSEAIPACSALGQGNHSALNPANPQYGAADSFSRRVNDISGSVEKGVHQSYNAALGGSSTMSDSSNWNSWVFEGSDRTTSTVGFYFCVPKQGFGNSKRLMCDEANNNPQLRPIEFHFGPFNVYIPPGQDADCYCRFRDQESRCTSADELARMVQHRDAVNARAAAAAPVEVEEADVEPSEVALAQFRDCIDTIKARSLRCIEAGRAGTRQCDPNSDSDSLLGGAARAAGGMAAAHNQSNIGTGAQDSCFQASLLSNAALFSANSLNNDCSDAINLCNSNCGDGAESNYFQNQVERQCLPQLSNGLSQQITLARIENSATASEETTTGQAAAYYQGVIEEGNRNFVSGRASCRTARQSRSTLENLISGVGRSLQSAAQCSCQYASSTANTAQPGTSNACASNLPNPNDCATNPTLPGCEVYRELSPCTPGATYNAQMCRCQTNPSATGCEGTQTSGAVASMAGSMIKAGAVAGPTGFGIPAGAVARNGIDLGGGSDGSSEGLQLDNKNGRAQLPKDPSVAGGGGAPPGGGATRDNGALAGGVGEEKSLAAGLMNAAKNVAKALGLKGGDKANGNIKGGKAGAGGKDPNFNSFRPRNVAGGSNGMGGKHMDIWKMMNKCVQAETCQSNMNNYILTP